MQETNLTRILRVEYQRGKKALQKALDLYRVSLESSADNWSADTCEQKKNRWNNSQSSHKAWNSSQSQDQEGRNLKMHKRLG